MKKEENKNKFIEKAKIIHNNKYNYSNIIYKNVNTKVDILCDKHGIFKQTPSSHLTGCGCNKCSYELRAKNRLNKTFYRKWNFNEDYFEKINTPEKAYFLGLLYADGAINKDKSISLGLQTKDIELLDKFAQELSYDKPYKIHENITSININSHKLYNDLINKGCFERKSFILKFPTNEQVPDIYKYHFIRGYFDGDGCCHIANKSYNNYINFLGCEEFLKGISNIFLQNEIKSYLYKIKNSNIYSLYIKTKLNINKLRELLYKDDSISLKRKKYKVYECS